VFSDDEGSDDEEEEVDENDNDDEGNDSHLNDDYHELDNEQDDDEDSPSFFFDTNSSHTSTNIPFGVSTSSKPEPVTNLSTMMANFDFTTTKSPFNFGSTACNTTVSGIVRLRRIRFNHHCLM
jgi:hypothetical protein